MFKGTGGHLGNRAGETCTAALGQYQAMGTQGLGTAHNCSKILGIGETVNSHQQGRLTNGGAALHQGRQIEGLGGRCLQGDALVHGTASELTQASPCDFLHQHTRGLGLAQQLQELRTEAHFRRAPDPVNRATALQSSLGRMAAPDQVGTGIDAVALRITAGGQAVGIDDQGLGCETTRRGAAPSIKTARFGSTAPFKATAIWATRFRTAALGTAFKAASGPPVVRLAV